MADVDQKYVFPIQIALIAIRPDISICTLLPIYVIIIELTRHCEEYIERWYSVKCNKYEPKYECF